MTGKTPVAWVIGLAVVVLAVLASLGWRYGRPSPPPVATATAPVREAPPAAAPVEVDAAAEAQEPAPAPSSPTPPSTAAAPPAPAEPQAALPAAPPAQPSATLRDGAENRASGQEPQFDVVRVQPSGDTVVAGRTRPGARVALLAGPRRIGEATADAGGQFVILPEPLPVGEHVLALELQMPGQEPVLSRQNVAVRLPGQGQGEVIVALTQPDAPTRILSDATSAHPATAPAAPAGPQRTADASPAVESAPEASASESAAAAPAPASSASASALAVRTVEAEDSGAFFATGTAPPGAQVRLYLNDTIVATVTADPAGAWSLRVQKGMNAGNYAVRADQVDARNGQVTGRVEVPFVYPEPAARVAAAVPQAGAAVSAVAPDQAAVTPPNATPAASAPDSAAAAASAPVSSETAAASPAASGSVTAQGAIAAAAPPSAAVVADLKTATVARGDSLWRISRQVYGRGIRYTQIYEANTDQIRNPRLIYPGQVFVLPQTD